MFLWVCFAPAKPALENLETQLAPRSRSPRSKFAQINRWRWVELEEARNSKARRSRFKRKQCRGPRGSGVFFFFFFGGGGFGVCFLFLCFPLFLLGGECLFLLVRPLAGSDAGSTGPEIGRKGWVGAGSEEGCRGFRGCWEY